MCGRSPAAEAGVQLHIDHVIPFSRGGASIIDNLQTLCQDCSLGKGNDESLARPV
jgi:5-methylcytosine-specific restriction endonuclease McrA